MGFSKTIVCGLSSLAPAPFDPYIAPVAMDPAAFNPACVGMRGLLVGARNPDIVRAIPAMIAGMPGPVGMIMRYWRYYFNGTWRGRTNANDNLRIRGSGREKNGTCCDQELLLHVCYLLAKHVPRSID